MVVMHACSKIYAELIISFFQYWMYCVICLVVFPLFSLIFSVLSDVASREDMSSARHLASPPSSQAVVASNPSSS